MAVYELAMARAASTLLLDKEVNEKFNGCRFDLMTFPWTRPCMHVLDVRLNCAKQ